MCLSDPPGNGSAATCQRFCAPTRSRFAELREASSPLSVSTRIVGCVTDETAQNAEKLFEPDGRPSPTTHWVTEFLHRIEQDQIVTDLAVGALAQAGVIKPWALTVPVGQQQVTVSGLHRIDEAALNALDDSTFLKLRKASGLIVAHGQLFSTGQVNVLARLRLIQQQMLQQGQANSDVRLS